VVHPGRGPTPEPPPNPLWFSLSQAEQDLQYNRWAAALCGRLSRGKGWKKQAIVAVARRLLVRLWAMLRDGTDWRGRMEDAGFTDEDVLGHCRGEGPHFKGCWVVDLIRGL
jgi:hypothetical protein